MSTLSTNMGFPISTVGVDSGLNWELNLNSALATIDAHTHAVGFGIPIQPNGLNINTDLTFNNNNATALRSTRFQSQSVTLSGGSDLGSLYEVGIDLYYNNGNGTPVRITNGASIAGTAGSITGLPSGTAGVAYASGVYTFQAATNTAANLDVASIVLRNNTVSSYGLTLSPPAAMAADFGLTLPTLPIATSFMQLDTGGNMSAGIPVSGGLTTSNLSGSAGILGSQLAASANIVGSQLSATAGIVGTQLVNATITTTQLATNSVGTSQLIDANVTPTKRSAAVYATVAINATATNALIGSALTITSSGRPVLILLTPRSSQVGGGTALNITNDLVVYRNSSGIVTISGVTTTNDSFHYIDPTPPAGSVTYQLFISALTASTIQNYQFSIMEL